ncbi:MAG: MFS transporter, partial [Nitrospinae bacterium]|nr:MFS transporter [Nitrospinota bacterium]
LISTFLYFRLGYEASFMLLAIPAVIAISLLAAAKKMFPHPERLVTEGIGRGKNKITKTLWIYIIAVSFVGMGTSDFPLIAYHAKKISLIGDVYIPLVYSLTTVVTGLSALLFGRLFDRVGITAVIAGVACSTTFAWFAFFGGVAGLFIGLAMWGIGMGAQESVMKAVIADMMREEHRGMAFGIFNASYGVFSFVGSVIIGLLYDTNISYLVYFSIASHIVAIVMLTMISGRRFY